LTGTLRAPGDIEVLDLSRTGLAFAAAERLQQGGDYEIELQHRGQAVRLTVNVRWVKEEEGRQGRGARYHVGAEFVAVLQKPATGLWDWILATS
jgi:hypothetical protein